MTDDRFGVVVHARDAWANAEELRALGARCVRTEIDDLSLLAVALREHPADVRVVVTLNAESGRFAIDPSDLYTWEATIHEIAERFAGRVSAVECLGDWSWLGIDPEVAVLYARRAGQILRAADSGIVSLLGSVGGPHWITRLREVAGLLTPEDRSLLGGACFQPFEKNARGFPGFDHSRYDHGEIDVAVQNAHDIVGMPIWVTGFGVTISQAGGEDGQARYLQQAIGLLRELPRDVLAAATSQCWCDRTRRPRPAVHALAEIMGEAAIDPRCFATSDCAVLV